MQKKMKKVKIGIWGPLPLTPPLKIHCAQLDHKLNNMEKISSDYLLRFRRRSDDKNIFATLKREITQKVKYVASHSCLKIKENHIPYQYYIVSEQKS